MLYTYPLHFVSGGYGFFGCQPHRQEIEKSKCAHENNDPMRLAFNETHHPVGIGKKIGLKAIRFMTEISQDETPERGTEDRYDAENREIHAHNAGRNRDQVPDNRQKARKKNAPCFVTTQPHFRPLKFLPSGKKEPAEPENHDSTQPPRNPVCDAGA